MAVALLQFAALFTALRVGRQVRITSAVATSPVRT